MTNDQGTSIGPSLDTLSDEVVPLNSDGFYEFTRETAKPAEPAKEPAPDKLYAGKYKTVEQMEEAFLGLQKKLGAPKEKPATQVEEPAETGEQEDVPTAEEEPTGDEPETDDAAQEADEQPLVDVEALTTEFYEKGELSDETLASLEKVGVSKEVTALFFQGVEAIQTLRSTEIASIAGSQEDLTSIVKWGTDNLDAAGQKAFNSAVDAAILEGDFAAIKLVLPSLKAQMQGSEPSYIAGVNGNPTAGVVGFESQSEMSKAMRDPRYSSDRNYVAQVQARLAVTTAF
jgi:hypothetical protein